MPEHLRALVVILILAAVVFVFAKAPACHLACSVSNFERRRNLWFGVTLAAFLSHNFWIFILVTAVMLLFALAHETNKLAMFFALLFAVPMISERVTGLGIVNYLFDLNYVRLLCLVILLPTYFSLRKQSDVDPFGRLLADKFILGYIVLNILLMLQLISFTATLRQGVFYSFIDIFLPYYVASRSLKDLAQFRDALMAFVVAVLILAAVGTFEFVRHWLLYSHVDDALGVKMEMDYLARGDNLRALASTGHSIVLGYVIAVGIGLSFYLKILFPKPLTWGLGIAGLVVGIVAPLSRGPWFGAVLMLLISISVGPSPSKSFIRFGLLVLISGAVLLASPVGEKVVDILPFVGKVDAANVTYRQILLERSIRIIMENPFFGSHNYMSALSSVQELRQGGGFVDLVNTYLGVGLVNGLVGLFLFVGFFILIVFGIYKAMRGLSDKTHEVYLLGGTLLSVLLGILFIIFTVSSISVIAVVYWSVAGLGVAFMRMSANAEVIDAKDVKIVRAVATS